MNLGVPARWVDVGFGASAIGWAVRDVFRLRDSELAWRIGVPLAAMNLLVGVLFLARRPARDHASLWPCALAVGSVLTSGAALALSKATMGDAAKWVFFGASIGAMLALLRLGRAFAILPASRGVEVRGPYAWIRHPAYFFECTMLIAAVAGAGPKAWAVGALAVLLVLRRIHDEETLLALDPEYTAYQQRVRYRLLPGIY